VKTTNPTTYSGFISTAKKFANQGEGQRLALMMLLLDTEPRKAIWQANPNGTESWDALIREEGLCTPTLFHDFKRATGIVDVHVFGVYASAAIAKLKKEYRARILGATKRWIDSHRVPPTYQRITKYVADMKKDMGIRSHPSTPTHALRAENNRLKRELSKAETYIDTLVSTLKKNRIRTPTR
jgi:hypothetical protein